MEGAQPLTRSRAKDKEASQLTELITTQPRCAASAIARCRRHAAQLRWRNWNESRCVDAMWGGARRRSVNSAGGQHPRRVTPMAKSATSLRGRVYQTLPSIRQQRRNAAGGTYLNICEWGEVRRASRNTPKRAKRKINLGPTTPQNQGGSSKPIHPFTANKRISHNPIGKFVSPQNLTVRTELYQFSKIYSSVSYVGPTFSVVAVVLTCTF